jgi:hypothetical protein
VAQRLADQYSKAGMDPQLAYARDDDAIDFRSEFGL